MRQRGIARGDVRRKSVPRALQGLAAEVDQLYQGLPEEMVRSLQRPPLLLQVYTRGQRIGGRGCGRERVY